MTVKKLSSKDIKQKVSEGWIHTVVLFELIGMPKDHVKKTMDAFLVTIEQDDQVITLSKDVDEVVEIDGGLFSAAAEVDYLIFGLEKLIWLTFNYMPASIEIKAPAELTFRDKDMSEWLSDLLAKLHEINSIHTGLKSQHDALVKNLNAAIRNSVLLALGGEKLDAKAIAVKVGIGEAQVVAFLEAMIKEGKLVQEGKKYKKK
jgi:hypothetical protein